MYDVFDSGRYIIESVNHRVDPQGYVTTCDCIKSSVEFAYEEGQQSIEDNNKDVNLTPTEVVSRL